MEFYYYDNDNNKIARFVDNDRDNNIADLLYQWFCAAHLANRQAKAIKEYESYINEFYDKLLLEGKIYSKDELDKTEQKIEKRIDFIEASSKILIAQICTINSVRQSLDHCYKVDGVLDKENRPIGVKSIS